MSHEIALSLALIGALLLCFGLGLWAQECRCDNCAYHRDERRRKVETAKREAEVRSRNQADMQHDAQHKGFGWSDGAPDKYDCPLPGCRRNKQSVE